MAREPRLAPGAASLRIIVALLVLLLSIPCAVADMVGPQCLPITTSRISPQLQLVDGSKLPSDLSLSARRNARYFFSKVARDWNGQKLDHANVLNHGSASIFFPEKECPTGCTAYVVRTNEHGNLVKPIRFVSHMIAGVSPTFFFMFLTADGERFVEIRTAKLKSGDHATEVHERRDLPAGYMLSPSIAKSCLLRGAFDFVDPQSPPSISNPQ